MGNQTWKGAAEIFIPRTSATLPLLTYNNGSFVVKYRLTPCLAVSAVNLLSKRIAKFTLTSSNNVLPKVTLVLFFNAAKGFLSVDLSISILTEPDQGLLTSGTAA